MDNTDGNTIFELFLSYFGTPIGIRAYINKSTLFFAVQCIKDAILLWTTTSFIVFRLAYPVSKLLRTCFTFDYRIFKGLVVCSLNCSRKIMKRRLIAYS